MKFDEFYELLEKNQLISKIDHSLLLLIRDEIKDVDEYETYLILFALYFSLIGDGNISMSLKKEILSKKWKEKLDAQAVLLSDNPDSMAELGRIEEASFQAMDSCLDKIGFETLPYLFDEKGLFEIDDGNLYVRKYNLARKGILSSLQRLFSTPLQNEPCFDYHEGLMEGFRLSAGQEKAFNVGLNRNLVITGGPGTGKTTSIIFLLMNLLSADENSLVYLVAPSGKASNRMKESLIKGLNILNADFKEKYKNIVEKISRLEESTIHRLLSVDYSTQTYKYNKDHQFPQKSIFIIDEASMIDICLFHSLLQAIPTGARVFIMGDKNQLPSVEAGAVFGELLKMKSLKESVVQLDESIRFTRDTKIYALAESINNGLPLPVREEDWKDYDAFEVRDIEATDKTKPVFYYHSSKEGVKEKDIVESITYKWGSVFFSSLQDDASSLDETDKGQLDDLFEKMEKSKILCAENLGPRGVSSINGFLFRNFIDKTKGTSIEGYYPGEVMMINKNNKMLDLYNGDSGILVKFNGDDTIYFMLQKSSILISREGKRTDNIFKIGKYMFYPIRMITRSEIDLAYAISIHKSQGSDYKNILVILPNKKGHPLLNRQIVYTAITRTKGNTYLLSSQERLEESRDRIIIRDTNLA